MRIIIVTFQREDKIKCIQQIPQELHPLIDLYTREDRVEILKQHIPATITVKPLPMDVDGIADTRQRAIDLTPKGKVWMIDDLCVFGKRKDDGKPQRSLNNQEFMELYNLIEQQLDTYIQVGISAQFGNNFEPKWAKEIGRAYSTYGLRTDIMHQIGTRFDTMYQTNKELKYYEDYFVTLDALHKGFPNLIIYSHFFLYKHNYSGGNSTIRTLDHTRKSAEALQTYFPDSVTLTVKEGEWNGNGMSNRTEPRVQWKKAFKPLEG